MFFAPGNMKCIALLAALGMWSAGVILFGKEYNTQYMTISGRVKLKGKAPSVRLVLATKKYGDLYITGRHSLTIFHNYQGQFIVVKGVLTKVQQRIGNLASFDVVEIVKVFKLGIEYAKPR